MKIAGIAPSGAPDFPVIVRGSFQRLHALANGSDPAAESNTESAVRLRMAPILARNASLAGRRSRREQLHFRLGQRPAPDRDVVERAGEVAHPGGGLGPVRHVKRVAPGGDDLTDRFLLLALAVDVEAHGHGCPVYHRGHVRPDAGGHAPALYMVVA